MALCGTLALSMRSALGCLGLAHLLGCFPAAADTTNPGDADRGSTSVTASRRPFIVNWAPTDRTALETRAQEGPVVIRWDATTRDAEVLPRCRVESEPYRFVAASHASQAMTTKTEMELGAHFPFAGPVNLGAMLERYGEITVEYHSIGEYRLALDRAHADDLVGDCGGATHVIVGMSVGAFEFFAGERIGGKAEADVPMAAGVSAGGSKSFENLDRGGNPTACDAASRKATEPPDGCDSVVAIELMAIVRDSPFVVGESWEGNYECNKRKATSSLRITGIGDDGSIEGTMHFDYADVVGEYTVKGAPDPASGELRLEFVEWTKEPQGYSPVTPIGTVNAESGEYRGRLAEDGCGEFTFVRRPGGG